MPSTACMPDPGIHPAAEKFWSKTIGGIQYLYSS